MESAPSSERPQATRRAAGRRSSDVLLSPDGRVLRPQPGAREARAGEVSEDRSVTIALTGTQVDQVLRIALSGRGRPDVSAALAGRSLHDAQIRKVLSERYRGLQGNRRLSRSLLAGLLVLSCFSPEGTELGIKDISDQLELNSSTVHRYVATLLAAGLLERDPDTRRYRLLPE
jgi:IclR helix-turn-helix domain